MNKPIFKRTHNNVTWIVNFKFNFERRLYDHPNIIRRVETDIIMIAVEAVGVTISHMVVIMSNMAEVLGRIITQTGKSNKLNLTRRVRPESNYSTNDGSDCEYL